MLKTCAAVLLASLALAACGGEDGSDQALNDETREAAAEYMRALGSLACTKRENKGYTAEEAEEWAKDKAERDFDSPAARANYVAGCRETTAER